MVEPATRSKIAVGKGCRAYSALTRLKVSNDSFDRFKRIDAGRPHHLSVAGIVGTQLAYKAVDLPVTDIF